MWVVVIFHTKKMWKTAACKILLLLEVISFSENPDKWIDISADLGRYIAEKKLEQD